MSRSPAARGSGGTEGQTGRRFLIGVGLVGLAGSAVAIVVASAGGAGTARPLTTAEVVDSATATPPWPAPTDAPARVRAAGLDLGPMGAAEHYHVHLDVLVNGTATPVAADIGVDPATGQMSGLHTHDGSGVVHIEAAAKNQRFTLGQLFTEWNVRLTATQLGGLTSEAGNDLRLFVNGKLVTGDPAALVLRAHQEIALVYGPADAKVQVPGSFDFQGT